MNRFLALFRKEFLHIRRDPLSIGILLFVPVLLLALYGYALSFDVKHIPLALLDADRTPASRSLADDLFGNDYFDHAVSASRPEEADRLLARGEVRAFVHIPKGYAAEIDQGRPARLSVHMDAADANTASIAAGYLDALADRATRDLAPPGRIPPSVRVEPRIWFNPDLVSARFLVPGLMGMLLMISATIAASLSIVREKERLTLEQIAVSAVRPHELLMGKTLPYLLIGLVTAALVLLAARMLFGVAVTGSYLLLALTVTLFLFAALALGLLISAVARTQQMAFLIAILASLLPSLILSGMIFPIANMPAPIRVITLVVVPRHFVSALRAIILKAAPIDVVLPHLLAMVGLGILFIALAARHLRRRQP